MNEVSTMKQTETNMMLFDDTRFAQLERVAEMMVSGKVMVPTHLKTKGDFFAIVMQSAQWGMNPYSVAQKTFLVNGTLGYEAQLINAVVSTSTAIEGRFHYEYGGNWEKILGKPPGKKQIPDRFNNGKMKWIDVKGWNDKDEDGLFIKVGATIAGEDEITWSEPLYMSPITTRNSSLWINDPKQQMAYLAVKKWARMYTPGVILGVYTQDEIEARDITPVAFEDLEKDEKLEAHKAKVKSTKTKPAAKKEKAPIEGTAEVVEETAAEVMSIDNFVKAMKNTQTQQEIKNIAAMGTHFTGADKAKASKAYKDRVAAFKAEHEQPAKPDEEETPEPRPISEAYRMLDIAKTNDDLDVACDFVLSLNQEGKTTKEELNDFQIKSGAMYDKLADEANASNN